MFILFTCIVILYSCIIICAVIAWKKYSPKFTLQHKNTSCTVIIAARNEEQNIAHILEDLCNQTYPLHNIQILVANDHSTDNTFQIAQNIAHKNTTIQVLNMPKHVQGKKQTLQHTLPLATGQYILFTDADCRIPLHGLQHMFLIFKTNRGIFILAVLLITKKNLYSNNALLSTL